MENSQSAFTPEEGIRVLETMLSRTQDQLQENGLMYRLWGYLVLISALIHYAGIVMYNNQDTAIVWAIIMPVGGLISWYIGSRKTDTGRVKTWVDDALKNVLITFIVSLVFSLLLGLTFSTWNVAYGFLMLAYGSWLFISGALLRFNALKIGGIINWIAGVACFFLDGPQCLLVLAFAVLTGYIIPGHLINQQYKREHGKG
jgi:hypothetical protein